MRSTRIQTLITMEIEISSIMMSSYLPKLFQAKARLCDLYNQMKNKSDQVVVDEFQSGSGTMRRRWKTMIGESILEKSTVVQINRSSFGECSTKKWDLILFETIESDFFEREGYGWKFTKTKWY